MNNDATGDTTPDAMEHATRHDVVSVQDAAAILGITPDSVRARLRRGTIAGARVGDRWEVHLPPNTIARHGATGDTTSRDATGPDTTSRDINLAPLVDHIARLEDQVVRLTEASTMWQIRARQAEEKLKALTAGEVSTDSVETPTAGKFRADSAQKTPPAAPGSPETNAPGAGGIRRWWRWLWGA